MHKIVKKFQKLANQIPSDDKANFYFGLIMEEFDEFHNTLFGHSITRYTDSLKSGAVKVSLNNITKANLTDDILDLIWVGFAALEMMEIDIDGAIMELEKSNMSKFPGGVAKFDENGKVIKPESFVKPDFSQFIK